MSIEPLSPIAAVPVLRRRIPLIPPAAFAVEIRIPPVDVEDSPDNIEMAPPVSAEDIPATKATPPPVPLSPEPTVI